jgi:acyl carrier protein
MTHSEKLKRIFADALDIDIDIVTDDLQYNSIPEWDSVAHMALITELEEHFDIMLDTDDIIDMSSLEKAKSILIKHDVRF